MRNRVDIVNRSSELPDDDVLELVHAIMHDDRSLRYRVLRDGPHDITHVDAKILTFFSRPSGATQSDLAQHGGRNKARLARLIKERREQGLRDGVADEDDRRNLRMTLTDDGKAVQNALRTQARRRSPDRTIANVRSCAHCFDM